MTKEQKQTSNDIILTFELARRDKTREQIPLYDLRSLFPIVIQRFFFACFAQKQKSFNFDNALDNGTARLSGQTLKRGWKKGETLKQTRAESVAETLSFVMYFGGACCYGCRGWYCGTDFYSSSKTYTNKIISRILREDLPTITTQMLVTRIVLFTSKWLLSSFEFGNLH